MAEQEQEQQQENSGKIQKNFEAALIKEHCIKIGKFIEYQDTSNIELHET